MCKRRTVTKREFERFKRAFGVWKLRMGFPEYELGFEHKDTEDAIAYVDINVSGCTAIVSLNNKIGYRDDVDGWLEDTAKHEAIHVLLGRLVHIAKSRFVSEEEIDRENERITRILEGLI